MGTDRFRPELFREVKVDCAEVNVELAAGNVFTFDIPGFGEILQAAIRSTEELYVSVNCVGRQVRFAAHRAMRVTEVRWVYWPAPEMVQ